MKKMTESQFDHFVRQYREVIETLIDHGAFETRNGTATLHFDNDGTLKSVKVEMKVYQR